MCDVKKYEKIFQEIKKLTPEDAIQITEEAHDSDTKKFYAMVEAMLLQKPQEEYIRNESY